MESEKDRKNSINMSWLNSPSLRPFFSPKWITKTKCTANIKGRYNESIDRCGIYGVDDGQKIYRCRDCGMLFRENKTRTYTVREDRPSISDEDCQESIALPKRSSGEQ